MQHARLLQIARVGPPEAAARKSGAVDVSHRVGHPGVAIRIVDIDIIDDGPAAEAAAIISAAAIPRMKALEGSERNPSYVAEAESYAHPAAESDEAHQGRAPVMPHAKPDPARIPAPPEGRAVEPSPVVIRGPAPRIGANPGPAIIILPSPPPRLIRGPSGRDLRSPHVAIGWIGYPTSVIVQIFRAIDIGTHVASAHRAHQHAIPFPVPPIPFVFAVRRHDLKFWLRHRAAHLHGPAGSQRLRAPRREDFHFAGANCDFGLPVITHRQPIHAFVLRADRRLRSAHFHIGARGPQHAKRRHAARQLNLIAMISQLGDANLGASRQPNHVGRIELHLGAPGGSGQHAVSDYQRRVHHRRHEIAIVAAANRNVAHHHAQPGSAMIGAVGVLLGRSVLIVGRLLCLRKLSLCQCT